MSVCWFVDPSGGKLHFLAPIGALVFTTFFFQIIGEEVQRSKPEKFADFLVKIRKLLVEPDSGLSFKDRTGLLLILESHLLRSEKAGDLRRCSIALQEGCFTISDAGTSLLPTTSSLTPSPTHILGPSFPIFLQLGHVTYAISSEDLFHCLY